MPLSCYTPGRDVARAPSGVIGKAHSSSIAVPSSSSLGTCDSYISDNWSSDPDDSIFTCMRIHACSHTLTHPCKHTYHVVSATKPYNSCFQPQKYTTHLHQNLPTPQTHTFHTHLLTQVTYTFLYHLSTANTAHILFIPISMFLRASTATFLAIFTYTCIPHTHTRMHPRLLTYMHIYLCHDFTMCMYHTYFLGILSQQ